MANGEHIEVAKAYVTIVPSLEGSQKSISEELGVITSDAAKTSGEAAGQDFGNSLATGLKATAAVVAAAMAAVTAAAVGVGKAFIDAANDVAEWGNTVDKESQKMNMSAAGYQEWAFILEHAGASIEGMKTSMKKLTVAAEEGNDAFSALGISQEQLSEMSPEETWNATIAALQNVSDEGERTALATQLLGKGAVELAPLFNMTAEETEELKDQVYELGGVMSDEAVKAAAEYEDQLQNMQTALTGLKNNMMSKFLPGMSSVMQGLSLIFSGQEGGIAMVQEGLQSITDNIAELTPQLFELAGGIVSALVDSFAEQLPVLTQSVLFFIVDALVAITNLIPQLLPTLQTVIQTLLQTVFVCLPLITSSLLQLISDLATWLSKGDTVKTLVDGLVSMVTAIVKQIAVILPILLPAVVLIIGEIAAAITEPDNLMMILDAVLAVVGAVVMALANCIPELVNVVVMMINNIVGQWQGLFNWIGPNFQAGLNVMLSAFKTVGSAIGSWLGGWIDGIKNTFNTWISGLTNAFSNGFNNIKNWITNILTNIGNFVNDCINTLWNLPGEMGSIAYDMVAGFVNGLDVDWVVKEVKKLGKKAISALKETLGIASPSKVFKELGEFTAEGFGIGYSDTMDDIESDMAKAADGFTASMSSEFNAYGAGGAATVGDTTNYNGGAITMNIYGAEGQDVNTLAEVIAERLGEMTRRKEVVYG